MRSALACGPREGQVSETQSGGDLAPRQTQTSIFQILSNSSSSPSCLGRPQGRGGSTQGSPLLNISWYVQTSLTAFHCSFVVGWEVSLSTDGTRVVTSKLDVISKCYSATPLSYQAQGGSMQSHDTQTKRSRPNIHRRGRSHTKPWRF